MAVYPGARYRPLNQFSYPGQAPRLGVVLHVNDSDGASLYGWIAGNPGRPNDQVSCHWQVAKSGVVEQYIDTDNAAWCQSAGNQNYLSIESEGHPAEALTEAQVQACAGIMAWCHATHGIPLVLAETPGQAGLIWHGAGGLAWGGHFGCPGDLRKAQRADILRLAAPHVPVSIPEETMRIITNRDAQALALQVRGIDEVRILQENERAALAAAGFPVSAVSAATYGVLRSVAHQ